MSTPLRLVPRIPVVPAAAPAIPMIPPVQPPQPLIPIAAPRPPWPPQPAYQPQQYQMPYAQPASVGEAIALGEYYKAQQAAHRAAQPAQPKGFGENLSNVIEQVKTGTASIEELVTFAKSMGGDPAWKEILNGPIGQNIAAAAGQLAITLPEYWMRGKVIDKISGLVDKMKDANLPPALMSALVGQMIQMQNQQQAPPGMTMPGMAVPVTDPNLIGQVPLSQTAPMQNPAPAPAAAFELTPAAQQQIANLEVQVANLARIAQAQQQQVQQVSQQLASTAQILQRLAAGPAPVQQAAYIPPAPTPTPAATPMQFAAPTAPPQPKVIYDAICAVCGAQIEVAAANRGEALMKFGYAHFVQLHGPEFATFTGAMASLGARAETGQMDAVQAAEELTRLQAAVASSIVQRGSPAPFAPPPLAQTPPRPAPHPIPAPPMPDEPEDEEETEEVAEEEEPRTRARSQVEANGGADRISTPPPETSATAPPSPKSRSLRTQPGDEDLSAPVGGRPGGSPAAPTKKKPGRKAKKKAKEAARSDEVED